MSYHISMPIGPLEVVGINNSIFSRCPWSLLAVVMMFPLHKLNIEIESNLEFGATELAELPLSFLKNY